MRVYLRNLLAGFVAVLLCVVALGMIYPAAVWGISRITPKSAEGNLIYRGECLV
ncbi:potassium-transporting ATPase subunit C, partial [uncultured Corynebacterium sp.]|uniref:potassium-transporting ATPase subunit C n=1 Tax=uncultured Corynebacterium sp. TaxID=159447 RepID=UPI002803B916